MDSMQICLNLYVWRNYYKVMSIINSIKSAQSYDIVLYSKFNSIDDLNEYQTHPEHVKVSKFIGNVREERVVVDYEI
jgi:hypothetical protein